MKKRIILSSIIGVLFIGGCTPPPKLVTNRGKVYLTGGKNCAKYTIHRNRIKCYDSKGKYMFTERPLSNNEVRVLISRIEEQNRQNAQLNYNLQQSLNRSNYNMQQSLNRLNTYKVRVYQPGFLGI